MIRVIGLALGFCLLTPALTLDQPDDKVIDLQVEGEICRENWQNNADFATQYDPTGTEAKAYRAAGFEYTRRSEALVERLANSNNAEEHLFRAYLLAAEPVLAAESLERALEIAPDNLLVLRNLASYCSRNEQAFCAEVANRLADSPQSTANELLLAATLFKQTGKPGIVALYEKAAQREFSNTFGQDLDYAWRMVNSLGLEIDGLEALGIENSYLSFAIVFVSFPFYSGIGVSMACDPNPQNRSIVVDHSTCVTLLTNLFHQATDTGGRSLAASLLLRIAEQSKNPEQLAEARMQKQLTVDFSERLTGLSCYDEGRFQKYFSGLDYLSSVIKNGEIATISALIKQAESGEIE